MHISRAPLSWATDYLVSTLTCDVINHHHIVNTAYSSVTQIITNKGIFFLKSAPNSLFREADILALLNTHGYSNVPTLVASNADIKCFLMRSVGNGSLRNLFKNKIEFEPLTQGISAFTTIQRDMESTIDSLLKIETPDWRLHLFANRYEKLIARRSLLLSDGVTEYEIKLLQDLRPVCTSLCKQLAKAGIAETLCHGDFHENNMILDHQSGKVSIIDWGESFIAHPFFSLNGLLWNITHFYDVKTTDELYLQLQQVATQAWADRLSTAELLDALNVANRLNGVFAALDYEVMYDATKDLDNTVQQQYPGSIAGCLRSFIAQNPL